LFSELLRDIDVNYSKKQFSEIYGKILINEELMFPDDEFLISFK
jgi:hypothetical protein